MKNYITYIKLIFFICLLGFMPRIEAQKFSPLTKVAASASVLGAGCIYAAAWKIYKDDCKENEYEPHNDEFKEFTKKLIKNIHSSDAEVATEYRQKYPKFSKLLLAMETTLGATGLLLLNDGINKLFTGAKPGAAVPQIAPALVPVMDEYDPSFVGPRRYSRATDEGLFNAAGGDQALVVNDLLGEESISDFDSDDGRDEFLDGNLAGLGRPRVGQSMQIRVAPHLQHLFDDRPTNSAVSKNGNNVKTLVYFPGAILEKGRMVPVPLGIPNHMIPASGEPLSILQNGETIKQIPLFLYFYLKLRELPTRPPLTPVQKLTKAAKDDYLVKKNTQDFAQNCARVGHLDWLIIIEAELMGKFNKAFSAVWDKGEEVYCDTLNIPRLGVLVQDPVLQDSAKKCVVLAAQQGLQFAGTGKALLLKVPPIQYMHKIRHVPADLIIKLYEKKAIPIGAFALCAKGYGEGLVLTLKAADSSCKHGVFMLDKINDARKAFGKAARDVLDYIPATQGKLVTVSGLVDGDDLDKDATVRVKKGGLPEKIGNVIEYGAQATGVVYASVVQAGYLACLGSGKLWNLCKAVKNEYKAAKNQLDTTALFEGIEF